VHFTVSAAYLVVWFLEEHEILNPILQVGRSSVRHDDAVAHFIKPHDNFSLKSRILKDLLINEFWRIHSAFIAITSPFGKVHQVLDLSFLSTGNVLPVAGVVDGVGIILDILPRGTGAFT